MTDPLHRPWPLRELVDGLRSGEMTPAAALHRSRARIAATERDVQAWIEQVVEPDLAPAQGLLGGVPLGVKDIIDLAGLPTRCGTALRVKSHPALQDAAIVAAWRVAGAVPIGKTVTTEFAYFAPGPTRNPAAPDHTPGGSSSGSAAAVAAGQVPLAIGSQTAGSVTRPAAYCGVASLVLSHDALPVTGVTGLSPSLDSHGMFAARACDLALAWSALSGAADAGLPDEADPPRVLVWSADLLGVDQPMRDALGRAAGLLAAAGATVDAFPEEKLVADVTDAHPVVMAYEAARERGDALARADDLSVPLARLLRAGAEIPDGVYEAERARIAAAADRVGELLTSYDVVLGPAAAGAAPRGLDATGDPALSRAWQAMGLPAVCVPGITDDRGLPLGIQLIGRRFAETSLLRHACWVERVLGGAEHLYSGRDPR